MSPFLPENYPVPGLWIPDLDLDLKVLKLPGLDPNLMNFITRAYPEIFSSQILDPILPDLTFLAKKFSKFPYQCLNRKIKKSFRI